MYPRAFRPGIDSTAVVEVGISKRLSVPPDRGLLSRATCFGMAAYRTKDLTPAEEDEAIARGVRFVERSGFGPDAAPLRKAVGEVFELDHIKVKEVSTVDAAANRRKFLIRKNDGVIIEIEFPIYKTAEQVVTGIVLEPTKELDRPDTQSDVYSKEAVRQAAYSFALGNFQLGKQHAEMVGGDTMKVLESWIAPDDTVIGGQPVAAGSWLMTVKVFDPLLWNQIVAGSVTGFSIGGTANRRPVSAPPSASPSFSA